MAWDRHSLLSEKRCWARWAGLFVLRKRLNRGFRFVFHFVSENISDDSCVVCTQTAFLYLKKAKGTSWFSDHILDNFCVACTGPYLWNPNGDTCSLWNPERDYLSNQSQRGYFPSPSQIHPIRRLISPTWNPKWGYFSPLKSIPTGLPLISQRGYFSTLKCQRSSSGYFCFAIGVTLPHWHTNGVTFPLWNPERDYLWNPNGVTSPLSIPNGITSEIPTGLLFHLKSQRNYFLLSNPQGVASEISTGLVSPSQIPKVLILKSQRWYLSNRNGISSVIPKGGYFSPL